MHHISRRILVGFTALAAAGLLPAAAGAQDKPVIASIVFQGDQFMKSLQQGIRTAASAGGAEVLEVNIDGDQARESQAIDTYISRGVNAIVIAPLSATNSAAAIKRARDAGITVVALNGGLKDASIPNATFLTDNADLGRSTGKAAAAFIKDQLSGSAKVGLIGFVGLLPEQSNARTNGFKETVADGTKVDFVATQDAWLPERGVAVVTDMLTAHPEINVVYAANEGGTIGAMQAVRNAGKSGSVYVFGIDGSEQLARGLTAGDNVLQAVTAQGAVDMGRMGGEAALAILKGEKIPQQTTVPAILLSRTDKEGISKFVETLK